MSDTEEQPTAVVVTQPKRALPGTGSIMTSILRAILTVLWYNSEIYRNSFDSEESF